MQSATRHLIILLEFRNRSRRPVDPFLIVRANIIVRSPEYENRGYVKAVKRFSKSKKIPSSFFLI